MVTCDICGEEFENAQGLAGHRQWKHRGEAGGEAKAVVPGKPLPLDAVVERLTLPAIPQEYNGVREVYAAGFNDGAKYGINTVLTGIRAAQELSSLGIQQATPLINMAKEMRQSEQQAAREAVQDGLSRMMPYLDDRLRSVEEAARQRYTTQNPMAEMFARVMEQPLKNLVGSMFGGQRGQGQPGQPAPFESQLPQGWTYKEVERGDAK